MSEFEGERETRVRIHRPADQVFRMLTDVEVRKSCMADLERHEKVDDNTYRWVLKEENAKGVRFRPDYTVRYENNGKDQFSWTTIRGNPRARGNGVCRPVGERETEVLYKETITADIPVPRLLAPVIRGVVSKKIAAGVDVYLQKVTAVIEKS